MSYFDLLSIHNLALLSDWLESTGELCVDLYLPHSGGGGTVYFIKSVNDLKSLMTQEMWPEIVITIFRDIQYPLRGIADDRLLQEALQQLPDGDHYAIISLNEYPSPCTYKSDGKNHTELRRDFLEIIGDEVAIGLDPTFNIDNEQWIYKHSNEVFRLSVKKNQTHYRNYTDHPEQYKFLENL